MVLFIVQKVSYFIIIIIIIIITIIIISFMQGIYTYIPETNYVPSEYSVAAILLFLFMVLISLVSVLNLLYFILVHSEICVQCPILLLLLLLSSSSSSSLSSSSSSPLCRAFILIFLRQTMSLANTVLQLFCCFYSWCLYR